MSGPKTSRFTLTAAQRQIILEQQRRERELRRIQMETELVQKRIVEIRRNISIKVSNLDSKIEEMEAVLKEIGEKELLINLKNVRERAMDIAIESNKEVGQANLADLRKISHKLQNAYFELQNESGKILNTYEKKEKEFNESIKDTIDEGFEISFYDLGIQDASEDECRCKVDKALEKISELHIPDTLQSKFELIKKKASDIRNKEFLNNYYALTVRPFLNECIEADENYHRIGEEFATLKSTYAVLCEKLDIIIEDIPLSLNGLKTLKTKIEELEAQALQIEEENYINECIDETMREMGYDLIGERHIRKKNGSSFTKELYLFEEGTAVNVTYASNGQITMELGGMDDIDRIPTKEESHQLTQNMRSFCDDYSEIEKRLRKKGVITKRISILPAEEQFAQIINVSDYEMNKNVSVFEAKSNKRKNVTNKAMHKEV